eukprot:1387598-Rhodomonas_salina.1
MRSQYRTPRSSRVGMVAQHASSVRRDVGQRTGSLEASTLERERRTLCQYRTSRWACAGRSHHQTLCQYRTSRRGRVGR